MWLEAVDSNGGGCIDPDMVLRFRAAFNDSGSSFDCATICEVKRVASNIPLNSWTHLSVMFDPIIVPARVFLMINDKQTVTGAAAQSCESGTDIPDGFTIHDSTQDVFIGIDKASGTDAFEGRLGQIQVVESSHNNFLRNMALLHMNSGYSAPYVNYHGGEDPLLTYAVRTYGAATPTPGNGAGTVDSTNKRYTQSFHFDGLDDYVLYLTGTNYNSPDRSAAETLLVEAWIRPEDADGGGITEQVIAAKWLYNDDVSCTNDTTNSAFKLYLDTSGKVNFSVIDSTGTIVTVTGNTVLSDNQWYHVAGVLTGSTTQYLTVDRTYVMVDGKSDVTTPTTFTGTLRITSQAMTLGAIKVTAPSNICSSIGAKDFFKGNIDEFRVNIPLQVQGAEYFNPGVVLNEVNYKHNSGLNKGEEVELYTFNSLGHSIDLNGYTLGVCSQTTKSYVFDNACGNCASKVVDPGDIVTVVFTPSLGPIGGNIDTSCSGAPTSCTWYTENTSSASAFAAGDINDPADGIILYGASDPNTDAKKFSSAIDAVMWGAYQGTCQDNVTSDVRGLWEENVALQTGLISDATRSLCLDADGENELASSSWAQCAQTIGSLNANRTTAIQLLQLSASLSSPGIELFWETGIEENVLGFHILRADSEFDHYVQINSDLVLSQGVVGVGSKYSFHDGNGKLTSYYKLQEVDIDGLTIEYGPVSALPTANKSEALSSGSSVSGSDGTLAGENNGSDSLANFSANGCGRIATSESMAGTSLTMLLLLIMFMSTRTFWLEQLKRK
jgi:hypothetical protein